MSLGDVMAEMAASKAAREVGLSIVSAVVREVAEHLGSDRIELARTLADHALDYAPVTVLRQFLDDAAVRRAADVADWAEDAKFGPDK